MPKPIKLSTPVKIPPHEEKISCPSKILTLGSCFSDHIGSLLANHLFNTLANPFGTVFNPISIARMVELAVNNKEISESDLHCEGGRYFHYDFHSSFDSANPIETKDKINAAIKNVGQFIRNIDFLILTFGTSIVYKLKSDNRIVSNCHKVPNHQFEKALLSADFMEKKTIEGIEMVRKINPSVQVILTVSPVRHTKEGIVENSLSKCRLIDLCHRMVKLKPDFSYFPSYEIMMDELRDYRFYNSDLIHPNELAIDIIWEYFLQTYFDEVATQKVQDIAELNRAKDHKPFDALSADHQKFKENQLKKIDQYSKIYPEIDFEKMIQFFED